MMDDDLCTSIINLRDSSDLKIELIIYLKIIGYLKKKIRQLKKYWKAFDLNITNNAYNIY